jgi:hypothetical protein
MEHVEDTPLYLSQVFAQNPFPDDDGDDDVNIDLVNKIVNASQKQKTKKKQTKIQNKVQKRSVPGQLPSFVINKKPGKGYRLIKIQIINLQDNEYKEVSESEDVILSAQYIADDGFDEIIDSTESVINKISKKLCGYSVGY